MSRKDYVLIARAIREVFDAYLADPHCRGAVRDTAHAVADELGQDNPSFDRLRFLEAALGANK